DPKPAVQSARSAVRSRRLDIKEHTYVCVPYSCLSAAVHREGEPVAPRAEIQRAELQLDVALTGSDGRNRHAVQPRAGLGNQCSHTGKQAHREARMMHVALRPVMHPDYQSVPTLDDGGGSAIGIEQLDGRKAHFTNSSPSFALKLLAVSLVC